MSASVRFLCGGALLVFTGALEGQASPVRTSFSRVLDYVQREDLADVMRDLDGDRCFDFTLSETLKRDLLREAVLHDSGVTAAELEPLYERISRSPCELPWLRAAAPADSASGPVPAAHRPQPVPVDAQDLEIFDNWSMRNRGISLAAVADAHLAESSWGGGIQIGARLSPGTDLLIYPRYGSVVGAAIDGMYAGARVTSLEVGGRVWLGPLDRLLIPYVQGGGMGSIVRVENDSGKGQFANVGISGGAGIGLAVIPRLMVSLDVQRQVLWSAGEGREDFFDPEENEPLGALRIRLGLTRFQ